MEKAVITFSILENIFFQKWKLMCALRAHISKILIFILALTKIYIYKNARLKKKKKTKTKTKIKPNQNRISSVQT